MKLSFINRLVRATVCTCLAALISLVPLTTQAAQTKTYSFTPIHAKNYVTSGAVSFSGSAAYSGWYSPDWKYRQKIVINKEFIGDELIDFPVVVRLNKSITDRARADLHDLVFTSDDGATELPYEREDDETVWVKVPKLTPTADTTLYVYYGNTAKVEDHENTDDVWSNGSRSVFHLGENPEGQITDSGSTDGHGTAIGGMSAGKNVQTGKIGKALDFNGTNEHIRLKNNLRDSDSVGTVSAWVKADSTSGVKTIVAETREGYDNGLVVVGVYNGKAFVQAYSWPSPDFNNFSQTPNILATGEWYHLTWVSDGATWKIYINGQEQPLSQLVGTNTGQWFSATSSGGNDRYHIGHINSSFPHYFNGLIDDVNIDNRVHSSAWIRAEYANQSDSEEFLEISSEVEMQSPTGKEPTVTLKSDRPLVFTSVTSFKANQGGGQATFQLSNDAGKSWLYYAKDGWKAVDPVNPLHRSSANDINGHLDTFPRGDGKLLWRVYLPSGKTLDQIQVTYTGGSSSGSSTSASAFPVTIQLLNTLFEKAYDREPSFSEWTKWAVRMFAEKKTLDAWLGAMEYESLRAQ